MYAFITKRLRRGRSCLTACALVLSLGIGSAAQAQDPKDTLQVQKLITRGNDHLKMQVLDSADYYYRKAGALAKKIHYDYGIVDHSRALIQVLNRKGLYQEALAITLEALEVSKRLAVDEQIASYNNVGNEYLYLGNMKAAATYFLQALKLAEQINHTGLQQLISNNLASVFLELRDKEKAYHYASQAYQLARAKQDSFGIASCLVNLGISEILTKQFKSAKKHLLEVIELGQALEDPSYVMDGYLNLGDAEMEQHKYQAALTYYQQALQVLHYYEAQDYELYIYWGMARAYLNLALYEQSLYYHLKSLELARATHSINELRQLYQLGSEIHEQMNNPQQALEYRKNYQVLNDSLLNAETQQNIHRMEIEYQTTKKEKEIAQQNLMLAQNNLDIEKKNNLIYLSLVAVISLLSAIIIFFIRYQSKQRANAQRLQALRQESELKVLMAMIEGEEKERARLARELHDGVGGILSATKMHLSMLRNEAALLEHLQQFEHTSSMLDSASQEVRTIAHNLSPDMLLRYELEEALANFCKTVSNPHLQVDFYYLGESIRLRNNFKLVLYRMVQEMVNNIIKHAQASHALVQLSHHQQVLSLTVEDNGVGFEAKEGKGIGLLNLQERVKNMHGHLSIDSSPGNGTTIYVEFDLTPYLEKDTSEQVAV
jgi:signal transduction histidine kinase